jgi:hypothetical protein
MYEIKAESLCNANFSPTIFIIMIKIYIYIYIFGVESPANDLQECKK